MLTPGDRVLIALSGGPDSVCLLHILNYLKKRLNIKLYIAHLNHGIRGKESEKDADFVKKLARALNIKLVYGKLIIKKTGSKKSIEEFLREKRYRFLKKAANKLKIDAVATAHTLDDQAETVLMRIIKGSTLKGLIGIPPVRYDGKLKIIRPFIKTEKREILDYLEKNKIPFRVDSTNLEEKYFRNVIRKKILPYLSKFNPRIKRSLSNLASSLLEDFEFINLEKQKRLKLIKSSVRKKNMKITDILLQPKSIQREIIREVIKGIGGDIKKLTYRHWKDIDEFIKSKPRGKSVDLPGRIRVKKVGGDIIFVKSNNR